MANVITNPFDYVSKIKNTVDIEFEGITYSIPKSIIGKFHGLCREFDGAIDNPEFLKNVDQAYKRYIENRLNRGIRQRIPIPLGYVSEGYLHLEDAKHVPISRRREKKNIRIFLLPTEERYEIAAQSQRGDRLIRLTDIIPDGNILRGRPSEERVFGGWVDYECNPADLLNALHHLDQVKVHTD